MEQIEFTLAIIVEKVAYCEFYACIYAGVKLEASVETSQAKLILRQSLDSALGEYYEAVREFSDAAREYWNRRSIKSTQTAKVISSLTVCISGYSQA